MKRIESACVEQIQHFETEMQCGGVSALAGAQASARAGDLPQQGPDGVTLHLRREYNGYSVGDYLKNEEEEA